MEIEKGETLTFYEPLSFESFISHWFDSTSIVAIMVVGDETNMDDLGNDELHEWPSELLGIFNIKPNFLVVIEVDIYVLENFSQCWDKGSRDWQDFNGLFYAMGS